MTYAVLMAVSFAAGAYGWPKLVAFAAGMVKGFYDKFDGKK